MSDALRSPYAGFPLARYRLHGVVERRVAFTDFAGAALRGAFGHALKASVCVTGLADCTACPLYRSCAFPAIFESPPVASSPPEPSPAMSQVAPPYVIEPPAPGPHVRAAGEPFEFELVLDLAARSIHPHPQLIAIPPAPAGLERCELEFSTPLHFARSGRAVPTSKWTAGDLLTALVRRTMTLCEQHLGSRLDVDFAVLREAVDSVRSRTQWRELRWQRYSDQQHRSIPMGGAVGQWHLQGNLTPFWPFLHLGQWLHVGKKCSFGLGRYALRFHG